MVIPERERREVDYWLGDGKVCEGLLRFEVDRAEEWEMGLLAAWRV